MCVLCACCVRAVRVLCACCVRAVCVLRACCFSSPHHGGGMERHGAKSGGGMGPRAWQWWPCKCGSWAWADRTACPSCGCPPGAAAAKRLHKRSKAVVQPHPTAKSGDGRGPSTITVGDFTLVVGKGKKSQRKVRQQMRRLQELAAAAEAGTVQGTPPGSTAAPDPSGPVAMEAEPSALLAMGDEELEHVLKALAATGLPGRDEYLAEQQRRKEARLASKPAWVKVRAVEAKWRKAQAKTSKAETASQHAAAAVDAAKTALAKAEATAASRGQ